MAQKIEFDYENQHYILEFSRNVCRQMESAGFIITEIDTKPATRIPQLFEGAFLLHHKRVKGEKIKEIYKHISRKDELIQKLAELYYEAVSTLMDEETEEDDPKKIEW